MSGFVGIQVPGAAFDRITDYLDRIASTRSPDMEWLESRIGRMDEINAQEHREAADSPTSGRPHHHGD
jgi:hypothetical protein